MQVLQNPLFRHFVIFLAFAALMVFCIDKSRQNERTRNTLYNCVYVLYPGAVMKLVQIVDLLLPFHVVVCQIMGLVLIGVAMVGYWKYLRPQEDIPFNSIFYKLGWIVLVLAVILQVGFLVMALMQGAEGQA